MMSIFIYFYIGILGLIAIFVLTKNSETKTTKTENRTEILNIGSSESLNKEGTTIKDEPFQLREGFCDWCLNYHLIYDGKCSVCIDRCD